MPTLTRRTLLNNSGILMAGSGAILSGNYAFGATTTSKKPTAKFSREMHAYVMDHISLHVHKASQQAITPADLLKSASHFHLYASHVDTLPITLPHVSPSSDSSAAQSTAAVPSVHVPPSISARVLNRLNARNPDLTTSHLDSYMSQIAQSASGTSGVFQNPEQYSLSAILRCQADVFKLTAAALQAAIETGAYQPAAYHPHRQQPPVSPRGIDVFDAKHAAAHLEFICKVKPKSKKQTVCDAVAVAGTGAGGVSAWLTAGWKLFTLSVKAASGSADAVAAYTTALEEAAPTVEWAAAALEYALDLGAFGPEAIVGGLAIIATVAGVVVGYCKITS
ncbi:hypothetical protein HDF16_005798 [Granulicella aggregans]|uniref:Uncharacterized protein n=1 Tax=Granulicella aggregans TaxID=474949 RepID=A0A7W7ZJS3_9BACT|nr:hypothetical protein [Granulicella aggregans]MBB5061062.1 hypothetical protein [Granulicella aggregans]